MSISLRADNRVIIKDAKFSYLLDNYSSGVSSFSISNTEGFFINSYVLAGNIGSENTEILQLGHVDPVTGALTFKNFSDVADTIVSPTVITFLTPHSFIAGQPVTVMVGNSNVVRGTGTIGISGIGNQITLTGVGIAGMVSGDIVIVNDITKFAHAESTKITVIQYNMVRFFRTNTPSVPNTIPYTSLQQSQNSKTTDTTTSTIGTPNTTVYTDPGDPSSILKVDFTPPIIFQGATALTNPLPIQVNDFYTTFFDTINPDGYGWYAFYNETTLSYSPISNNIPYGGFDSNTVRSTFDAFDSLLNTKELKLITTADRYRWLNEGLSIMVNELNLGNWEFNSSDELILTLKAGISSYLLPNDFSGLLFMNDALGLKIESYSASFERPYTSSQMRYLIRGKYVVFNPVPQEDTTVTVAYLKTSSILKSLDDIINLPDRAYFYLTDFMLYRAYEKLGNGGESDKRLTIFNSNIDRMKITSIKRDEGLDSWTPAPYANV